MWTKWATQEDYNDVVRLFKENVKKRQRPTRTLSDYCCKRKKCIYKYINNKRRAKKKADIHTALFAIGKTACFLGTQPAEL